MAYSYEEYRVFYYVNQLMGWMESNALEEGSVERNLYQWTKGYRLAQPCRQKDETESDYVRRAGAAWKTRIARLAKKACAQKQGVLAQNLDFITQVFDFTPEEKLIVEFLALFTSTEMMGRFGCCFNEHTSGNLSMLLYLLHCSRCEIDKLIGSRSKLRRWGLIESARLGNQMLVLQDDIANFLMTPFPNAAVRQHALVGDSFSCDWQAKDFKFVPETRFAVKLFKTASREKGCNILLYGEPGTGKTNFAGMLAASAGKNLYTVAETRSADEEVQNRLQELYRKQKILEKMPNACLLFDEAEDVFSPLYNKKGRYNKVEINRLLENNGCPIIWTTNNIREIDPAFIRRFTLAVCFERPGVALRQQLWKNYLAKNEVAVTAKGIRSLATAYEVSPALIAGASRAARLTKGNIDTVKTHVKIMTQALHGGHKQTPKIEAQVQFYPQLIQADTDLPMLTAQLKTLGRLDFSLCLYGVSGTGKSAYARFLARQLELEVLQQRASDLISPYVGETEQNIANAFAKAKENKMVLIFDEADTFLQDRTRAVRSWEISSVNEMLTWMENHPYPFICTTNLMDTLDPASLRRFSFKVKYDYLTTSQVCQAFNCFLGFKVDEKEVANLTQLTPGDFALIKNKAEILGKGKDIAALKALLETEQQLKQKRGGPTIGFRV